MYGFNEEYRSIFHSRTCENVLTSDMCDAIVDYCNNNLELEDAAVGQDILSSVKRRSKIGWISNNDDTKPIYELASKIVMSINDVSYQFNLAGFYEPLQYTEYNSEDSGFYKWHTDTFILEPRKLNPNLQKAIYRKISCSILLNDTDEFDGGIFQLKVNFDKIGGAKIEKGSCVIFPSFIPHRVTPVTRGVRKSLVLWAHGPQFR